MNWNKILLTLSWVALISLISATAGYMVYGPHVPLPYVYQPETATHETTQKPEDEHSGEPEEPTHESLLKPEAPPPEQVNTDQHPTLIPPDNARETASAETPAGAAAPSPDNTVTSPEKTAPDAASEHKEEAAPENHSAATAPEVSPEISPATSPETSQETLSQTNNPEPAVTGPTETTETAALSPAQPVTSSPVQERSPDLHQPNWQRYSQQQPADDGRPRIAIVLTGLGLSRAATDAAIRQLPGAITLSFTPYAKDLDSWIALAHSHNHEVLIDLPMEPLTYPSDDPGPQALLTGREPEGNLRYLAWIANRGSGYVGMSVYMGERFVTSERQMKPVMEYFKDQGLLFLDNGRNEASLAPRIGREMGSPVLVNNRAIDEAQLSRVAIDSRLAQVEQIALRNGYAIATGRPFPVTLERMASWIQGLDQRGYQLVPLTAVIPQPDDPASAKMTSPKNKNKQAPKTGG
ncbi:divergent polysaccharide deacetylase family protein [Kiloniella laminariae]|uniref:Divergent polysaccharide deacetylase family protein n=1 Tax=Kiloniella laminariae TaxID=454162 RepID=A0ABT4LRA9_9PROT|nr:divergent polysaccharide deacetylase family protein [Kiloniella laminariae]MCZ4282477.1 divergent polysaccharide deacetylase family protein [Kiloniella laminariae]